MLYFIWDKDIIIIIMIMMYQQLVLVRTYHIILFHVTVSIFMIW